MWNSSATQGKMSAIFDRCLAGIWLPILNFLLLVPDLHTHSPAFPEWRWDTMLYDVSYLKNVLNSFLLVLFTLCTLRHSRDLIPFQINERRDCRKNFHKRVMIDSVQRSQQVWRIFQTARRRKAKQFGTHGIAVVHCNRLSLSSTWH